MVMIGQKVDCDKGKGIVRATFGLDDGRLGAIVENKGRNFVLIEGDDF